MYKCKCGEKMKCLKNGFNFIFGTSVVTSDLWGCYSCRRLEIRGIPAQRLFDADAIVAGWASPDPDNEYHLAILEPEIGLFSREFNAHMKEWNPDFPYKTSKEKWVTGGENA